MRACFAEKNAFLQSCLTTNGSKYLARPGTLLKAAGELNLRSFQNNVYQSLVSLHLEGLRHHCQLKFTPPLPRKICKCRLSKSHSSLTFGCNIVRIMMPPGVGAPSSRTEEETDRLYGSTLTSLLSPPHPSIQDTPRQSVQWPHRNTPMAIKTTFDLDRTTIKQKRDACASTRMGFSDKPD